MSATGATPPKITAALLKKKGRRTLTHPVVLDDDTATAYRLAERAVVDARDTEQRARAQATLAEAEAELREATLLLRLRAMRPADYAALKAEHPPTEDDNARAAELSGDPKAKAKWHTDTFGPALVAACLTEPELTLEQAAEIKAEWNDAEWSGLLFAAIQVNETATDLRGLSFS
jgi:hypothetical protein